MKVVCNTNVLVSGILFGGHCRSIIRLVSEGRTQGYTSAPLIHELEEVLIRPKFRLVSEQVAAILEVVRESFATVIPTEAISVVTDDPDDDAVIEAAVAAGAEIIISGDDHLLSLGRFQNIEILSPATFIASWESGDS
ncbi:MAG: putative PIN family toxin of toxin-antitoxin system [Rhodothermales bacterium]|jgi:putative PIN family toxin of toxin-antitoxin system